jgi:hypothetical protein
MMMPLWLFLVLSFAVAAITGFANSSHGALMAQVIGGVLSILSLAAVVAAFCFYGWKIGLLDFPVVLIAANVGVSLFQSVKKSGVHLTRGCSYRLGWRDDSF